MNKNNIVLIIAGLLILIGLIKPDLSKIFPTKTNTVKNTVVNLEAPTDEIMKKECDDVVSIIKNGDAKDAVRLRDLFIDLSDLIALDQENEIIHNTEEIKQANSIAGLLLDLDIKGKYENLAKESKDVIVSAIGDDAVPLNAELRTEASKAFRYLAWAYNQGAK